MYQQKTNTVEIDDIYTLKISVLWRQLKQEHLSFWFLCGYFFFEYVRPQTIYPALDFLPWAKLLLLGAVFFALTDRTVRWQSHPVNKLLIIFLMVILLSSLLAFSPMKSWERADIFLNWFLVYFLVVHVLNTEKRFAIFFILFLLCSFKMSLHGLMVWGGRGFSFTSWGLMGPQGWFHNSGEYAIQMLILLSCSVPFAFVFAKKLGFIRRWIVYLIPISAAATVLGASSRGSQFALAIMIMLAIFYAKQRFRMILLVIPLLAVGYALLPDEQLHRIFATGEDNTSLQRLEYWKIGLDVIKEHPVLGVGYGNWVGYLHYLYPDGVGVLGKVQESHNIFIQVTAESGIFALLVFLLLVCCLFACVKRVRRQCADENEFYRYLATGLFIGVIGYLAAGFFVTVFYYPFFWVQMALIVAVHNLVINNRIRKDAVDG